MHSQDDDHEQPLLDGARELDAVLNPPGGALGINAPFSLTAETPDEHRDTQPGLFSEDLCE